MSNEDKIKVILKIIPHLQFDDLSDYCHLPLEDVKRVYEAFSDDSDGFNIIKWLNAVLFIDEHRHFFSLYGITANVESETIYYCGKRLFW